MKKQLLVCLATCCLCLTACGSKDGADKKNNSTQTQNDAVASNSDLATFALGTYKGLSAQKVVYEVTDQDVENEIYLRISDYAEYKEVSRASQEGDYVNMLFTATVDDEVILDYSDPDEGGYDIRLGDASFGEEYDRYLTGKNVGDTANFTIEYPDDFDDVDFAGNTVTFDVTVSSISEEVLPEITEDFLRTNLGFASESEMKEKIKEELIASNNENSESNLREDLMSQVMINSTLGAYPQELYDSCKQAMDDSYAGYAELIGCEDVAGVYEAFGMTEDDIAAEVLQMVYRQQIIDAICEEENLTVSDAYYKEQLEKYAKTYEYESAAALEEEVGKDNLIGWMLEDLAFDVMVKNANITEVTASETDAAFLE
ncbi:MAG: FKBP-type peptidyl-prolyl cis-trans isomerase [Wujia sp.]